MQSLQGGGSMSPDEMKMMLMVQAVIDEELANTPDDERLDVSINVEEDGVRLTFKRTKKDVKE
jgi:hypothetical protein